MTDIERSIFKFLIAVDVIAVVISMIAGPLDHTVIAIGTAGSAALISVCLIIYGLYFWPKDK